MYIDGDSHYWPIHMLDRVDHPGRGHVEVVPDDHNYLREGQPYPGRTATYYRDGKKVHAFKEGRFNLDARYEWMDRDGFDLQVLIPENRPLIYECDPELGRQLARAYNDTVAADIAEKDRFIGCAWVYLPDVREATRELRRAVEQLGHRAVKLAGGFGNVDLDSPELYPFYEEVARLDVPLLVHPAGRIFDEQHSHPWLVGADRYEGFPNFPTALGFPLTYIVTISRLIFSGTLDRFPTLRFAFFEGGCGWVPFLMNHLDRHLPETAPNHAQTARLFEERGRLGRAKPSDYFDQFYIAAVSWEPYIADIVKWWPNHNIITGSDFDHGDAIGTWPSTISRFREMAGLSDEDRVRILGGNAQRLFKIGAPTVGGQGAGR